MNPDADSHITVHIVDIHQHNPNIFTGRERFLMSIFSMKETGANFFLQFFYSMQNAYNKLGTSF